MNSNHLRHQAYWRTILLCGILVAAVGVASGADITVANLALSGLGARARSWEPGAAVVPEHEPNRANDASFHTYWVVRAEDLPADLGVEWPQSRKISSVIVRYFDGRMVRGPAVARTQQWARLQAWNGGEWKDLDPQVLGQETSVVRYVFAPVTTTRLRVLFTEPPDPEARRSPDRLGIYVAELEAYATVPFQWVASGVRIAPVPRREGRSYLRDYNEPPSGDSGYDVPGPLIIEPKQTRIFTDTLAPTLIVAESRWARDPCVVEQSASQVRLRNGFLQLELSTADGIRETRLTNRASGGAVPTPQSRLFVIRTPKGEVTPASFKLRAVDTVGSGEELSRVRFDLTSENLDVAVHYELRRQDHFYHKWLTLSNKSKSDLEVQDVVVSWLELPRPVDLMAGQELTYPVSRLEKGGFFSCLETIYWDHQGDALTYYPGVTVAYGKTYMTEKAVVGAYGNRGEQWVGWDRGVREWVLAYHDQVSPLPQEWPDVYCEAWSANFGVKDLIQRPEWAERFMSTAEKLGIRYMDAYEASHDALVMPPERVKQFVDLANRHNIATGWWTDFGSDADFGTGTHVKPMACKLSPEAETYFQKLVELARTYKLRCMHWGDFLSVWQCNEPGHGHLPGKHSIYAQGQRMLRFNKELHEASPGIMLGADGGYTNPQYVRYEDGRGHGTYYGGHFQSDHFPAVEPDLHLDRLYADMNRVWVSGSHAIYLRPWFRMINCVNHFGQETHTHDRAGFRYALLSALAMAGQVTFNDIPDKMPESEIRFAERWLTWARTNKDYLKQGDKLFDRSQHFADVWQGDADSLSGFAHIRGDRGYVFLMNPTPVEQIAELTLALDAAPSTHFVVQEVFPTATTLQGPADGEYPQGGRLRLTVPGKQVRIVWIAPASSGSAQPGAQPENVGTAEWRRYVDDWTVTKRTPEAATLRARFDFPASGRAYLSASAPESAWASEPWGYDKAYLVFLLKDETEELNSHWVPDNLPALASLRGAGEECAFNVVVNGVRKAIHSLKTKRNQVKGSTRCYFVDLQGESRSGEANEVEITLPIRSGLVFSGAYLDLPDQVPSGTP
jgi:hypothetical protein